MNDPILARFYSILAALWRSRYTIVLPIVILPVMGILVCLVTTEKYQSHMSFLVQEKGKNNPYLEDLSIEMNVVDRMEGLKTLLHSRHILKSVVEELQGGQLTPVELEKQIAMLSSDINVRLFGSNLINISYTAAKPGQMSETLSVISKHFIANLLAPTQSSISSSETFLQKELGQLAAQLDEAEQRLAAYKRDNADTLPELYHANVHRLRANESQLEQKRLELAGAEQVFNNLQNKVLELDPVLASMEKQLVSLKGDLALLRARYTDKHSAVQGVLRKIKRLESERQALMQSTPISLEDIERFWAIQQSGDKENRSANLLLTQISSLQDEQQSIDRLQEQIAQLELSIESLQGKVQAYGSNEKQLRELTRDINVKSKVYEDLLERFEKSRVTRSLGEFEAKDKIKVIDKPFEPIKPLNLPMSIYIILGIVGGLFTGIGFAVLKELVNNRLYDVTTIERLTGVPVLTRLPKFEAQTTG